MKAHKPLLALAVGLALASPTAPHAEDIDLFVSAATSSTGNNPNVLIILDNSANWSSNSQHWTSSIPGESPFKQGQSELRALRTVVLESTDKVNIGLAMFRSGSLPDGIYIRSAVRTMNTTNKQNLADLIGDSTCVNGTGANGTPKCIFKNFDTNNPEKVNSANIDYGAALFDAFKYFGGCTSPSGVASGICKTSPLGPLNFGKARHSASSETLTATTRAIFDQAAYTDASMSTYVPPAGTANSCAKNYVILIGNGFPKDDIAGSPLAGVEGQTNQLAMPTFTSTSTTTTVNLTSPNGGFACGSGGNENARRDDCTKNGITSALKDPNPADSYACVGSQISDSTLCSGGSNRKFQVQSTKTVFSVTATGLSAVPASNKARMADEWARFLYTTDVGEATGFQNVQVYTIDVFKDQQDADQTALLFSMAKYGGGRYFQASSEEAILKALRDIMIEIQSVNSVFASASLPINATNRSQNENQVFIGMFRPDSGARPRWYGNLKKYKIGQFGQEFKLADADDQEAVSSATGFIQPCARSFWTTDTTSSDTSTAPATDTSYWNFSDATGSHIGSCTTASFSLFSDRPDGPQVEKGAAAQVLRLGNLGGTIPATTPPDYLEHRSVYTCANTGLATTCNLAPIAMHPFNNSNVAQLALGAVTTSERDRVINFTRGLDVWDENSRLTNTDVRPTVHGDVAHSRPLPVNYGGTTGVVLLYGANDGAFRAVSGNTGQELWAFIAPEHHSKLKRLYENGDFGTGLISYPPTPAVGSSSKDYFFDGSAGLFQNLTTTAPFFNKVWVFPSMRRGGRMIYAFNITTPTAPTLLWRIGCTNASLVDTASCIDQTGAASSDYAQMGQTWSTPAVARVKGFSANPDEPVIIVGGGYDTCEDQDAAPNTACNSPYQRRGNRVFVINAATGEKIWPVNSTDFPTDASVAADITLVDRDLDGMVDHAYAADTRGGLYRIDFVDPANPGTMRAPAAWTMTKIGQTASTGNRKFLFAPAALPAGNKVYLSIASGDRERPLLANYPYPATAGGGVLNRGYMLVDTFATTGLPVAMDDTSVMEDYSAGSSCPPDPARPDLPSTPTAESLGKKGWFINLNAASATGPTTNVGEQAVTSSTIFGGLVFFSTNRPVPTPAGACAQSLGEARGYAVNLLNASGAADTLNICGGARSQVFVGGGLPPSPVTGTVPVGPSGRPVTVMIGGVQRGGGVSSPIGAQRVVPTITQRRGRTYWYNDTDK
jgi:type IV pilus assembly protein PilY1